MRPVVHRYLGVVHRLKKAALCLRGRAVDLVSQHDMREKGTGLEFKILPLRIIDRYADDIRRQEVTGKLDPLETAPQGVREALRERRLSDAWHILDQQMATRQQGQHSQLYRLGLPFDDAFDVALQRLDFGDRIHAQRVAESEGAINFDLGFITHDSFPESQEIGSESNFPVFLPLHPPGSGAAKTAPLPIAPARQAKLARHYTQPTPELARTSSFRP
jgi:hypothetical protein